MICLCQLELKNSQLLAGFQALIGRIVRKSLLSGGVPVSYGLSNEKYFYFYYLRVGLFQVLAPSADIFMGLEGLCLKRHLK